MRSVVVLGSTGSIGLRVLSILEKFSYLFEVNGLTAFTNINYLAKQIVMFNPKVVAVKDELCAFRLDNLINGILIRPKIFFGESGFDYVAGYSKTDIVFNAIVGSYGLFPTLSSIKSSKILALANKESLVMAGGFIKSMVIRNNVSLLPVDSEHAAINQCMLGVDKSHIKEVILTASGGPFFNDPVDKFFEIGVEDALEHPNWSMGRKISIDSATLMNKAFEIIECRWLFNLSLDKIKVLIHPESIVHSMVSFLDNSTLAQMSVPDMKIAIGHALFFPNKVDICVKNLDLSSINTLSFYNPDNIKFPCLNLGYITSELGGVSPVVMNASNELAVESFLEEKIIFTNIYYVVKKCIDICKRLKSNSIFDIVKADSFAKNEARKIIEKIKR